MNSVLGCDNPLKCKTISWCTRNSKLRQVIDYHYYFYVACRNRDTEAGRQSDITRFYGKWHHKTEEVISLKLPYSLSSSWNWQHRWKKHQGSPLPTALVPSTLLIFVPIWLSIFDLSPEENNEAQVLGRVDELYKLCCIQFRGWTGLSTQV